MDSNTYVSGNSYLAIFAGGVGGGACGAFRERHQDDGMPPVVETVQIDTDRNERQMANLRIDIGFEPQHVEELQADPQRFGLEIVSAVKQLGSLLHPTEVSKGARTEPLITQCAMAYHEESLLRELRKAIDRLVDKGPTQQIQPVIIGSNGGGTSRAVTILLPLMFADQEFRSRLLAGLSDTVLAPPIVMVAYPVSHVRRSYTRRQETNILSNHMAWHMEMDVLLRAGLVAYPVVVGYSNPAGVILDESDEMKEVLGHAAFDFMVDRGYFESRWTDTIRPAHELGYLGRDCPELLYPAVARLMQRFDSQEDTP